MSDDGYKGGGPSGRQVTGCLAALFVSYFIANIMIWEFLGGCAPRTTACTVSGLVIAAVALWVGAVAWFAIADR